MSAKALFRCCIIALLGGIVVLLGVWIAPVRAQCDGPQPSSCTTCHAQQNRADDKGEWHSIHAGKDICLNCHGGNGSAMDKDLAHAGLAPQPISDVYTSCHGCHPDYMERAGKFAATLQITPAGCATPSPVALGYVSGGPPPGGIVTSPKGATAVLPSRSFLLIFAGLAMLVFFIVELGLLERRRVKR